MPHVLRISCAVLALAACGWAGAGAPDAPPDFDPARLRRVALWGDASLRHAGTVTCILPLPDGKRMLSAARDGTARLWSLETGAEIRRYAMPAKGDDVWSLALLPGGRSFLSASSDGRVREWDLETGATNRVFDHGVQVFRIAVAPDGRSFAAGDGAKSIVQWNLADGQEIRRFAGHKENVYAVAFADGGRRLISGSADQTAKIWDVATGECLRTLKFAKNVSTVASSPDGRRVLVVVAEQGVECHSVETEGLVWKAETGDGAYMPAWASDGSSVFVPSSAALHAYDGVTGESRLTMGVPKMTRWACARAPDGGALYASVEHAIRRIDPKTLRDIGPGAEFTEDVSDRRDAAWVPSLSNVVWVGSDGEAGLRRFDPRTGVTTNGPSPEGKVEKVAASADGAYLALVGSEGNVVVLKAASGAEVARIAGAGFRSAGSSMVFDAKGTRLLVGRQDGSVTVHEASNGAQQTALAVGDPRIVDPDVSILNEYQPVNRLAVGRDGRFVAAAAGSENRLAVWDLTSGQRIESLQLGQDSDVNALAFLGSDGRSLLGAVQNRIVAWPSAESRAGLADADAVKRLVAQMGADDFATREAATRRLIEMGEPALLQAEALPCDDPEVGERLKTARTKIGRQKAADPEPVALDLGGACTALYTIPGGPFWIAIAGANANAELVVGEYRGGALRILRRIEDGHGPAAILAGPGPRSFLTSNRDGTFSVYEW